MTSPRRRMDDVDDDVGVDVGVDWRAWVVKTRRKCPPTHRGLMPRLHASIRVNGVPSRGGLHVGVGVDGLPP
jgi:hypothetical protein